MHIKSFIFSSLLFTVSFLFLGCETDPPICNSIDYGEKFEVVTGETYCFDDDQSFTINGFINNYCPCNAYCLWEGELLIEMLLQNGQSTTAFTFHSSDRVSITEPPNGWKIALAEYAGDGCTDISSAYLLVTK